MPEIGATLREARMRQRIDISDIEAQTKIRAKYLRALENEEWDLIPGTTFVKSFLRTYADALGLDARALLEEYKLRYERLSETELLPMAPQTARQRAKANRQASRRPSARRDVVVAACLVALVALLIVLGKGGDDSSPPRRATGTSAAGATTTAGRALTTDARPATPKRVRLRLNPTSKVYVCLKAGDRLLIDKRTLTPTSPKRTYTSKRFRVLLGNSNLTMTIDGKRRTVAPSSKPIAFAITAKGRQPIDADADALCT